MKRLVNRLEDCNLEKIYGGGSISGTLVNAFTNIIKVLYDAGHAVGSSIRRINEDNLCPIK